MRTMIVGDYSNRWVETTSGDAVSTLVAAGTYRPERAPTGLRRFEISADDTGGGWNGASIAVSVIHPSGYSESIATLSADGSSGPWLTIGGATVEITVTGTPTGVQCTTACEVE